MDNYCIKCGTALVSFDDAGVARKRCEKCRWIHYTNPFPAAATLTASGDRILLVKRGVEPRIGLWALPSGFEEYSESPEEAAVRETKEETGLDVKILDLFALYYVRETDKRCILIVYTAAPLSDTPEDDVCAGDDAVDARFFRYDELPGKIAFRSHRDAIEKFFKAANE